MASSVREVTHEEAGMAVVAAAVASGPAPLEEGPRRAWLGRVASLARELSGVAREVRLDMMRTIKEIPVEGVLEVARNQNNRNRIYYTVDSGGRYTDSLWSEWLEGEALEAERRRLESLNGKRVRLVKVTQIDFDHDERVKTDDKGDPEQRSFARDGVIEIVDGSGDAKPVSRVAELDAKRRLVEGVKHAGFEENEAKRRAKAEYEKLVVTDGTVAESDLARAILNASKSRVA